MIKVIIFDFDGVIVDTHSFNFNAVKGVFKKKKLEFSDEIYNKYFVGHSLKDALHKVLHNVGREAELNEFISLKKEHDKHFDEDTNAFTDALEFIQKYKEKYRMMIATGCRPIHLEKTFEKYEIGDVFEFTITAEDVFKGKPDPEVYLRSLSQMNVKSSDAVVIEDTSVGIKAAKAAGIKVIAVTNTSSKEELMDADLVVDKLTASQVDEFLLNN